MQFEFATVTQIIFGPGTVKEVPAIARKFGARPFVVTGKNANRAEPLLALLRSSGLEPSVFPVPTEPTITTITEGIAAARNAGADCVVGFGGGSALDAGKAIGIMATNPGELLDYLEVIGKGQAFAHPSLPFVAVPTTAGTGSEVTRNAVIGSPEHRAKASLRSPHMLPRVAIVDPDLTLNLPPNVTATSGMDALTQLIEPFVCRRANPMTDALCREAIPRVARSLQTAVTNGDSPAAREDMALASLFGGLALSNAGLGAVHGFANPIGGMFSAPHGGICAALLPYVMSANLQVIRNRGERNTEKRFTEVATMLTGNAYATADDGVRWVFELVQGLIIPSLRTYGVSESDLDEVVAKSQKASSMKANPIELTAEELRDILKKAI